MVNDFEKMILICLLLQIRVTFGLFWEMVSVKKVTGELGDPLDEKISSIF